MKYYIQTLGCAMNYSDTERVSSLLEKMGYKKTGVPEKTDLYIFNTCSVRQKGEDRVHGQLRNLAQWKKKNPRLLVGITGCMVRKTSSKNSESEDKDSLLKGQSIRRGTIDFVFNIKDSHKLGEILKEAQPALDLPSLDEANLYDYLKIKPNYSSKFQAFIPIQVGCDKYCTYCIVPYARGREQSRPMEEVLEECKRVVENGCKEITLVGQTVNSYGTSAIDKKSGLFKGGNEPFITLLYEIDKLKKEGLNRVRFTSPHPKDFTDKLIQAHVELETLCNHVHLPVQAGHNSLLKRMNRQYTVKQYKEIIKKIRTAIPDCAISTDIIVGFCGETDEEFEGTYNLFKEMEWDMAYLARYSPRPGTTSGTAWEDDVPKATKAARWHQLNDFLNICSLEKNKACEGKTMEVLVESFNKETGECEGKARNNKVVQFPGKPEQIGELLKVKITKGLQWLLKGEQV